VFAEGSSVPNDPAPFPRDDLRAATDNANAHAAIDALHAEIGSPQPDPGRVRDHVATLQLWPSLIAPLERWYLDPRTQTFIADLTSAGL
jgi:hypothetical protein